MEFWRLYANLFFDEFFVKFGRTMDVYLFYAKSIHAKFSNDKKYKKRSRAILCSK
jgi:hypothetical protein